MWSLLLQTLLGVTFLHFWIKHQLSYWKRNGVCSVKSKYLFGNMKKFGKKHFSEIVSESYEKLKRKDVVGGFYFFLKPKLLLFDPEIIGHVLVKDASYFSECEQSDQKLAIEGRQWKELRGKITPTATEDQLKCWFEGIQKVGEEFQEFVQQRMKSGQPVDVQDLCTRFTADVVSVCALGERNNSLRDPKNKFKKMARKLVEPGWLKCIKSLFASAFVELSRVLGIRVIDQQVNEYFGRIIRKSQRGGDGSDLLNSALAIGNQKEVTVEEVTNQFLRILKKSLGETANSLTWIIYELARNPSVQERLRKEMESVLQRHGNKLTVEAIQEMQFLDKVILESLRLHPTIATISRVTREDYQLPSTTHVLTEGTVVLVPVKAIHNDPEYYSKPEEFNPERFNEEEVLKRPPFTYFVFGEDSRGCLGRDFAILQIKLGLIWLFQKRQIRVHKKTKEPVKFNPKSSIVEPKNKIWIEMVKRD